MKVCGEEVSPFNPWWSFQQALRDKLSKVKRSIHKSADIADSAKIIGDVHIGRGTRVYENTVIRGPVHIGLDVLIGGNAIIRSSSIGDETKIGSFSECAGSLIGEQCSLAHVIYAGNSLIGNKVTFAGAARLNNMRFDREPVKSIYKGKLVSTGIVKLGSYIGSGSNLGGGVTVLPGRIVAPDTSYGPGITVSKNREGGYLYMLKQEVEARRFSQ